MRSRRGSVFLKRKRSRADEISFEGRPLGYAHIGEQAVRGTYRFLLASASAVAISTMPAAAEMLYLKCQFADYRCSPQTFRINLKTGDWGSYCPGRFSTG